MNNKCSKEKLEGGIDPVVVTLNDVSPELRKKAAGEPTYITHL